GVEERSLGHRPSPLLQQHRRTEPAAAAWKIQGRAGGPEDPIADDGAWEGVHLLPADARPEITVHELDDRRDLLEITLDGKVGHVVRVAHVGCPIPESVE